MGVDQQQGSPSYYSFLGQWHPDRRTRTPSLLGEAKLLSDQRKRTMHDAGLNDPLEEKEEEDDDDEGLSDFEQEVLNLTAQDP
ncbi:hypothetical protein Peur_005596 [Populus x canadensis]